MKKNTYLIPLISSLLLSFYSFNSLAENLKTQMILALQQDQQHRNEINHLKQRNTNKKNIQLIEKLQQAQNQLDQKNLLLLDDVIHQLGHWPGISDVGENSAKIAMLLFKRSDIEKQANYLPLILKAVKSEQLPAFWYSEAYDHHLMLQNLPQKFGHFTVKGKANNTKSLYPIKSISAVNYERKTIGLPPLKFGLGSKNLLLREDLSSAKSAQLLDLLPADKLFNIADLALTCLDQIYPNSVKHVLNSDKDAASPQILYPAFFGCFDWHSSVHGHWLLARSAKLFPKHAKTAEILSRLNAHFTTEKLQAELNYFQQPGRAGFERPYGLAWFLQLYAELYDWQHPQAQQWLADMQPLKKHIVEQLSSWIPKLAYPIRTGEHSQTAFAFGLAYDYAQITNDRNFLKLLVKHSKRLYLNDQKCPISYEPSGQDFLSPCLAQADLMRRIIPNDDYAAWLKSFLPNIKKGSQWLPVAQVTDRVDGKLAHLDGLNIARAWMLEGIASGLPVKDKRRSTLIKLANQHAKSGLAAVTGEHYAGGHWLGSFASYYLTQRGFSD